MKCNCVELLLRRLFRTYSGFLCRFPLFVILLSIFIAAALGAGIMFIQFHSGTEYLFSPISSRAKDERATVHKLFPVDDRNTLPNRLIYLSHRRVDIVMICKDGGNILRREYVRAILDLDEAIWETAVHPSGSATSSNFTTLCSQWNGECFPNPVIFAFRYYNKQSGSVISLPFPEITLPINVSYKIAPFFGQKRVEGDKLVAADAILMSYYLQTSPEEVDALSAEWETVVSAWLDNLDSDLLEVYGFTSTSLDEAQTNLAFKAIPYLAASYAILITFAIVSCIMVRDGAQSKPWLGIMGVVSASFAMVSAVGLLCYCGVPFNQVTLSMPFIILGIGLDDMFIMISAWRKTDPTLSVKDRMAGTLEDAAVSITITSLTDIIAFIVGSISPIPAIRIFCLYTGVAVLFDYFYQLTFFGACMVLFGHMESFNCHGFTCVPMSRRFQDSASTTAAVPDDTESNFVNGRVIQSEEIRIEDESIKSVATVKTHAMMIFFRDYYSKLLVEPLCMAVVCVLFLGYIATAGYFLSTLKMGLEEANIAEEGTMTHGFFRLVTEYFEENGRSVSVVLTEPYPYWEPSKQEDLENFLVDIHGKRHVQHRNHSDFWLDAYKTYLQASNSTTEVDPRTFVETLKEKFLKLPCCERFKLDINFNNDGSEILSSRFVIMSRDTVSSVDDEELLLEVRDSIDAATEALGVPVIASSMGFVFTEQYIIIVPTTLLTLGIAVASMLLVSVIMIPNLAVGVLVTLSVATILMGVIGFMALWDVALESISMVNLVLCIGFSVDFSAHVAYALVMTSDESSISPSAKLSRALYLLGYPIIQSGLSTIFGVLLLFWSTSYIFRTFAKIMTLVMVLGMLHGLVFLPVVITLFGQLGLAFCSYDTMKADQRVKPQVTSRAVDNPTPVELCT